MPAYQNVQGTSPITDYEIDPDDGSLTVHFAPTRLHKQGRTYLFTAEVCGGDVLESMIELALTGMGLATYIARNKPSYARRW